MENNLDNNHSDFIQNESLNIREEIEKYSLYWKWFLLGLVLSFLAAFLYLRYSTPLYNSSATIMIKDNQKSGISKELSAISDLGIVGTGSVNNTDNEIEILKSRKIIGKAIDSLNLDISYFVKGRIINSEIYIKKPVEFIFIKKDSVFFKKDTVITISQKNNKQFYIKENEGKIISTHNYNEIITTNLGTFKIKRLLDFYQDVFISVRRRSRVIDIYRNKLLVTPVNKNSSVLNLSIKDPVKDKAVDFLDELITQYNLDAINDKSEVSKKTRDFLVERIDKIGDDLSRIQDSVKTFKKQNNITGLSIEGELALGNVSKNNRKIIEIKTELLLTKSIYKNLNSYDLNDETLPPNLGFKNSDISESILKYNELVVRKNALSLNAGKKNPQLIQYKAEIATQRNNLKRSIKNTMNALEAELTQLNRVAVISESKVSSIPVLERGFIDIARQQEIISGLFSYLLKKKEETDISLAVTVSNAKIIDKAYSSGVPVSPKRKIIYLAAVLVGLLIPFVIIYLKNLLDTKVHNKKDIEGLITVPYLGDIPRSESNEKVIVGNNARSSGSEAFRLIRTNLDFMLANKSAKNKKFIFITSTTSGEGKSFISINLAATLALSGKKVLLMGMDLRAPKVTEYLGLESRKGVTNYITSNNLTLEDLKFNIPEAKGLDIISSGAIPPNPAELLNSKSVEDLFAEIKDNEDYDYVVVDTAPVNLVTDTLLISKYADMFLYVVRANYLDKRLLSVSEELYKSKRLPNMSIVLNDTDPKRSYGYGYGGYGSYGYGYVEEEEDNKPWYKKIFS